MKTDDKNIFADQQLNNLSKEQLLSLCRILQDKNSEYEKRLEFLTGTDTVLPAKSCPARMIMSSPPFSTKRKQRLQKQVD